jgi:hypothetical protein
MIVTAQPGLPDNDTHRIQDRRYRLRHLGRAEIILLRDDDVMRAGLKVGLQTICAGALAIVSPVPLRDREQIKVRLRNDVQRFITEMRGAVRRLEPTEDGKFLIDIELFARLMPLDVMMLRRAGMHDVTYAYTGPIWV